MQPGRRRWLAVSAAILSFGVAFVYAGNAHLFYPNFVYQYKSHGVVLDDEPKEVFRLRAQDDDIVSRIDEDFLLEHEYRGSVFNIDVDGGSRTYYIEGSRELDPWQNKAVMFLGVLMSVFGLTGLVPDRKHDRS